MSCYSKSAFRAGDSFVRPNYLEKVGDVTHGHTHNFDHMTVVLKGAIHVKATLSDGRIVERDFTATQHCTIYRDVVHEITATEDHTLYWCVYTSRDPETGTPCEWNGWEDAFV